MIEMVNLRAYGQYTGGWKIMQICDGIEKKMMWQFGQYVVDFMDDWVPRLVAKWVDQHLTHFLLPQHSFNGQLIILHPFPISKGQTKEWLKSAGQKQLNPPQCLC